MSTSLVRSEGEVVLESIPKLPKRRLFASLRTKAKIKNLIERTNLICGSMRNALEHANESNPMKDLFHLTSERRLIESIEKFQHLITNRTILPSVYLSQAQVLANKLIEYYEDPNGLPEGNHALYQPYFKATVKELEKLHTALK